MILTDVAKSKHKVFCAFCEAKYLSVCACNYAQFYKLNVYFFAGLTRTATKIGGDLLPHPQTPFMKIELHLDFFLSRHCSFSVSPSLAPKLPMRHDPVDDRNDLHVDGRPPS